jgi:hypothetical protein
MSIERYSFEDSEGAEQTFATFSPTVAEETARRNGWRVIANLYEWTDSEPVPGWDFTKPSERKRR